MLETGDFDSFYNYLREKSSEQAFKGRMFEEMVIAFHFFEESYWPIILQKVKSKEEIFRLMVSLDKLHHNQIAIMASSHFYSIRNQIRRQKDDLEKKNRLLWELQQLREELTEMLVHDLKAPLSSVITSLSMLEENLLGDLTSEQREIVNLSLYGSNRLLNMVSNILDLNKMNEDRFVLSKSRIHLPELFEQQFGIVLNHARIDKKEITFHTDETLPPLHADPEILVRIIENLLSNALKYTEKNTGKIEVHARYDDAHREVSVSVSDNGGGIPKSSLDTIFDRYVTSGDRRDSVTTQDMGLGLTFCKKAVEAHGGTIQVESSEGEGSTFTFALPVEKTQ